MTGDYLYACVALEPAALAIGSSEQKNKQKKINKKNKHKMNTKTNKKQNPPPPPPRHTRIDARQNRAKPSEQLDEWVGWVRGYI